MRHMIRDVVPFSSAVGTANARERAIAAFLGAIERRLGVVIGYDHSAMPFEREGLYEQARLAEALSRAGIVEKISPVERKDDEPLHRMWGVSYATRSPEHTAGGLSWRSDAEALSAALAEALERHLWTEADDYFVRPRRASARGMRERKLPHVPPKRFAAFSKEQRHERPELSFTDETPFLWIEGVSLVSRRRTYLPAQTASGYRARAGAADSNTSDEPLIRHRTTNGLATWPTQAGARLAGALEIIERDAYLIMWYNQLTLPRLDLASLGARDPALARFLASCERYRFALHAIPLPTDAPTHAVCVVLEDISGKGPRFGIGLKAHRSLARAIEKASLEALRGWKHARTFLAGAPWDDAKKIEDIGHFERAHFWALPENAEKLTFLIEGAAKVPEPRPWDDDTEEEHLARIALWCRERGYECVAVPLTRSRKNPTAFHIEMIVIPELQALHLFENKLMKGGERWQSVPRRLGLEPRGEMFTALPHPFI